LRWGVWGVWGERRRRNGKGEKGKQRIEEVRRKKLNRQIKTLKERKNVEKSGFLLCSRNTLDSLLQFLTLSGLGEGFFGVLTWV
jgi:hypothetical protein